MGDGLEIVEEKRGYRINLPIQDGESERFVFQSKKLELFPQLNIKGSCFFCPSYRRVNGSWRSYSVGVGEKFEDGSLEYMAFEMMRGYVGRLVKDA